MQALLLFNVGDQELTAGELRTRGHYLGSNVSYNLKKLVEAGYIHHERSEADRRSVLVRLTARARSCATCCANCSSAIWARSSRWAMSRENDLDGLNITPARLERFWIDQVRFRL